MSQADKPLYRPDIDGLRAIAVVMIIVFHLQPDWLPAGFIGVDIFFVISGYLITRIIASAQEGGRFSFARFYRNRIRRIVPMLCVIITVVLVVGQLILLPEDLERLSWSALASQLFMGNVYFAYFLDTGYFALDANTEPLLHLWSLGVEEQFYLLWPVLLILGLRHLKKTYLCALISLLVVISFAFGEYWYHRDPMFVFYMLPSRAGELLVGALCFFLPRAYPGPNAFFGAVLSGLGLILLLGSVLLITEGHSFPGLTAVPVTAGAALVVLGGRAPNPVAAAISNPLLLWLGLRSYSLYLWHWPVITFTRYLVGEISAVWSLGLGVLIVLLSWASYRWVESPLRTTEETFNSVFRRQMAIPTGLVVLLSLALISTSGLGIQVFRDDYVSALKGLRQQVRRAPAAGFICQQATLDAVLLARQDCIIGRSEGEPRILLWGDSTGSHYVPALQQLARKYGFSFRNIAHSACPPVLGNPAAYTKVSAWKSCADSSAFISPRLLDYETIIISGNWSDYLRGHRGDFKEVLGTTIALLREKGKRVILLGQVAKFPDYDRFCAAKALKTPFLDCAGRFQVPRESLNVTAEKVRGIARANGASFIDFNRHLCRDSVCYASIDGSLVYYDKAHLSIRGSALLGMKVRDSGQGRRLFRALQSVTRDSVAPTNTTNSP